MFLGLISMVDENACKIYFESAINISLRGTLSFSLMFICLYSVFSMTSNLLVKSYNSHKQYKDISLESPGFSAVSSFEGIKIK